MSLSAVLGTLTISFSGSFSVLTWNFISSLFDNLKAANC